MQTKGFSRYLSSAPALAVLTISVIFTLFILINWVVPGLLSLGQ